MYSQETADVDCPYCGEGIELLIDTSIVQQEYIEDCPVCCRPITVSVVVDGEAGLAVSVRDENS